MRREYGHGDCAREDGMKVKQNVHSPVSRSVNRGKSGPQPGTVLDAGTQWENFTQPALEGKEQLTVLGERHKRVNKKVQTHQSRAGGSFSGPHTV